MHPKNLSIFDYTYVLPDERIAKYPLAERDNSKLLVFDNGNIASSTYINLADFLPAETLLIFNNTRVIEARLLFQKPSGGIIEIFCLEPDEGCPNITTAMGQKGKVRWKCLVGGAGKWKHGTVLKRTASGKNGDVVIMEAAVVDRLPGCFIIELSWEPQNFTFAEMIYLAGSIPLPPYLHRNVEEDDKRRYQTVYAKYNGSVAAPTAGLHFTQRVFRKLEAKNIKRDFVTLHVGAGTFKPVKSEIMSGHEMHAEFIDVSEDAIINILQQVSKPIVAVGTTSLRTIESLYWMGVKASQKPQATIEELMIQQWDAYEFDNHDLSTELALKSLLAWMKANSLERLMTRTQILIAPGYQLKVAKGIITNFHQPQSTLLLLVAAMIGNQWKEVYQYALDHDFRFLSYGDGCLLWNSK